MKFGPVTKLDKRNKKTSKKFDDDIMSGNCNVIVIFQFMDNLEQSESKIPDAISVKLTFSITANFYFAKNV